MNVTLKFLIISNFPDLLLKFRGPLIEAILAHGLQVHVAVPDVPANSQLRQKLEIRGLHVHEIPLRRTGTNPFVDLATFLSLVRLMIRIQPKWVLSYTIKPVIYGTLAAWLTKVPKRYALVTGLGYAFLGAGERVGITSLAQRLYAIALCRTSKVFFQNPDDERLFRDRKLLPAGIHSCLVNGSGVDVQYYPVVTLPASPSFLMIARLIGDKGVREYAEAARRIRAQYPEAVFNLVGWIDVNPDAISQQELDTWVEDGRLKFHGRLEDVRPAIADCSVYVLPSYREGTPRTVLEAMAMGRAIITTDAPGCRETVIHGDNGFLVPVKSVDALVAAMERFIEEPALVTRMGRRSREIAEEKYDVHKVNAVMLKEMKIV